MQKIKRLAASLIAGLTSAAMLAAPVAAASTTVVVNDLNADGWSVFTRDTGTIEISDEFGAPDTLGSSALKLTTPLSNDKALTGIAAAEGTTLDSLTNISYFTYRSSASTSPSFQTPSINIGIDVNGAAEGGFTTLVYEPVYQEGGAGAVLSDQWQQWDAGDSGIWWSTNAIGAAPNRDTFVSLADIKAANPDAVVLSYMINQGGGNAGLIGGADGLTINETIYDFELESEEPEMPATKDDCKNGGWKTYDVFKNQGDCVSFVASQGRNQPAYANQSQMRF